MATPTLPFNSDFSTVTTPEANQLTSNWINQVGNFSVNTSTARRPATRTRHGHVGRRQRGQRGGSGHDHRDGRPVRRSDSRLLRPGRSDYYFGGIVATSTGYNAYIYLNHNGVYTGLNGKSYTGSANGVLTLEIYDSSLKLFLNGTLIAYGNDTTLTGGSVGIRSTQGATFSSFSASALTVATPTLPFSSDFSTVTTPEANQLTSNWINQVGNFSVNTSTAVATSNGALDMATLAGVNAGNVEVQATITATAGQYAGLIADYSGPGDQDYYFGGIVATSTGYNAYIFLNHNGVYTGLNGKSYTGSANGVLTFEINGSSLELLLNGASIASANDTTLTGGSIGIRSTEGATFSSFCAAMPL